jgi:hypothetical protein
MFPSDALIRHDPGMRYATAVRRLQSIAEECDRHAKFWEEPLVVAAYVHGELLKGPEEVELVRIALVVDLPPHEVTWWAEPPSAAAFAEVIGLGKAPVEWWWRPVLWPVWNHEIRGPVRFWSLDGPDEVALEAIAAPPRRAAPAGPHGGGGGGAARGGAVGQPHPPAQGRRVLLGPGVAP